MKALKLFFAITALMAAPISVGAQEYPSRPVKIVVGFPAGTSTDIIARIYADDLSKKLKQPFIVENVSGAASNRAAAVVSSAPARLRSVAWSKNRVDGNGPSSRSSAAFSFMTKRESTPY